MTEVLRGPNWWPYFFPSRANLRDTGHTLNEHVFLQVSVAPGCGSQCSSISKIMRNLDVASRRKKATKLQILQGGRKRFLYAYTLNCPARKSVDISTAPVAINMPKRVLRIKGLPHFQGSMDVAIHLTFQGGSAQLAVARTLMADCGSPSNARGPSHMSSSLPPMNVSSASTILHEICSHQDQVRPRERHPYISIRGTSCA